MTPQQARLQHSATHAAYERWASSYPPFAHNPLMRAEQAAMLALWPEVLGRHALDLACGTGRYAKLLNDGGAAHVVALDFSDAMLQQVAVGVPVRASMMSLPFTDEVFDVVTCGLASGHAAELHPWMLEIARVLRPGGTLLYSDFHPEAIRAGLKRSFSDDCGRQLAIPHRPYCVADQKLSAAAAGLTIESVNEIRVGIDLREPFEGSERFYATWHGVPLVLVVRARK